MSWILGCTLAAQFALLALSLPVSDLFSGKLFFHIDHPYHLYQIEQARALLKQGLLIGYDPFFSAGYVGGISYNASAKLPLLFALLLPSSVSTGSIYALYVFLCALAAPAAVVVAAWLLRWPVVHTASAAVVGLLFWWISAFHWYHTAGMVSFVCASYVSIAYGVWAWLVCTRASRRVALGVIAAGVVGGMGLWLHPLFVIPVGVLFLALFVNATEPIPWFKWLTRGGAIALVAVLLNLPWLLAMGEGANLFSAAAPYQRKVGWNLFLHPILGIWSNDAMGAMINPICLTLVAIGMLATSGIERRQIAAFALAGAVLLVFSAFGAAVPKITLVQPNRFMATGFLMFGLGAAFAIGDLFAFTLRRGPRLITLGAIVAILPAIVLARELVREMSPGTHAHYGKSNPEITSPPPSVARIESWIRENTNTNGRILFEASLGRVHGNGHVAGYLALATGREFIGGPYPFVTPQPTLWDHAAFGSPVSDLSPARMTAYLNMYNVGWIIAHSEHLIALVESLPNVRFAETIEQIRLYSVQRPLTYFRCGSGRVESRDFNNVKLSAVEGGEVCLSYNWVPRLTTTPQLQMVPEQVEPGLPPLIRILNPPRSFILHRPH